MQDEPHGPKEFHIEPIGGRERREAAIEAWRILADGAKKAGQESSQFHHRHWQDRARDFLEEHPFPEELAKEPLEDAAADPDAPSDPYLWESGT